MSAAGSVIVSFKSINCRTSGDGSLIATAKHNNREISAKKENFDPERSHLNQALLNLPSTGAEVVALADRLMAARGFKPARRDAAIVVEGMFSLSEEPATFDMLDFFEQSARWMEASFGGDLLSVTVHRDEAYPHAHVLVLLPLVTRGPSGSDLIGHTRDKKARCEDHFKKVAQRFGLSRPFPKLSAASRNQLADQVRQYIATSDDPIRDSRWLPFLMRHIDRDPLSAARIAGIALPSAGPTLAALARSKGAGPRTAAAEAASDRRLHDAWEEGQRGNGNAHMDVGSPSADAGTNAHMGVDRQPAASREVVDPEAVQIEHPPCVGVAQNVAESTVSAAASELPATLPAAEFVSESPAANGEPPSPPAGWSIPDYWRPTSAPPLGRFGRQSPIVAAISSIGAHP